MLVSAVKCLNRDQYHTEMEAKEKWPQLALPEGSCLRTLLLGVSNAPLLVPGPTQGSWDEASSTIPNRSSNNAAMEANFY